MNPVSSIFHACKDLKTLRQIQTSFIVSDGINNEKTLFGIVPKSVSFYTKFSDVDSSLSVGNSIKMSDTFLWNSAIKDHVDAGVIESAFCVYKKMREMGVEHDSYTFPIVNQAVLLNPESSWPGKMIHSLAIQMGFACDVYFCNTMIEVYLKSRFSGDACKLFNEMPCRDVVSWTTMISGYVAEGDVIGSFRLFNEMRNEVEPNAVTILVMLQLCSNVVEAKSFHGYLIKNGYLTDGSVGNSMLKLYTDLGKAADAEALFGEADKRDVVSWNIILSLYSTRGEILKMVDCFCEMWGKVEPSSETLTVFVSGLAEGGNFCQGRQIHCLAEKKGLCDDKLRTCFLDFYAKCGEVRMSTQLYEEIRSTNSIICNAMMLGFLENGLFKEAIELLKQLQAVCFRPAAENLRSLVVAYTRIGGLQLGKGVHGYAIRNLFLDSSDGTRTLETSILNMYLRCGSISAARICFDRMVAKDLVAWTSMIEGYGTHGLAFQALELFKSMLEEGIEPNSITFLSLLSACSHSGLLSEGCDVLYTMKWDFNIQPDLNHYTCIVDLLGRSGRIKDALAVILKLVPFPDSRIWGALLAASRVYMDRTLGEYAAKKLLELEPYNVGYYTLLSNMQASAENWTEVEEVRSMVRGKDWMKQPGCSWIESKGLLHCFVSGYRSHPSSAEILEILGCLSRMVQD